MTNPTIEQIGQYLKDLSFENYAVDVTPAPTGGAPVLELNINLEVRPLGESKTADDRTGGDYETVLNLRATARVGDAEKPLFVVEIAYVGRYRIANVPETEVEPFLLIEAPRLLFPFVRQIAADAAMQGGLPPLLLAPVDFAQLYVQQKQAVKG